MIDGAIENCISSSDFTIGARSGAGALPCQAGLSSMCSTALPFMVRAMIIVGTPLVFFA